MMLSAAGKLTRVQICGPRSRDSEARYDHASGYEIEGTDDAASAGEDLVQKRAELVETKLLPDLISLIHRRRHAQGRALLDAEKRRLRD